MIKELSELLKLFPELKTKDDDAESVRSFDTESLMGVYLAVCELFQEYLKSGEESKARDLLRYSKIKLQEDKPNWPSDLSTAIIIGFFENFGHCEDLWRNLDKWFTRVEYENMKEHFEYLLDDEGKKYLEEKYKSKSPFKQ